VCSFHELKKSNFPLPEHDYRRLRAELADLFDLRGPDFTIEDLLATPYATHSPALENDNAYVWAGWIARLWGGTFGVWGAGLDAFSSHSSGDSPNSGASDA
jgi:hypothetical protein